ncbi:alpha/beta fold hydrolase [Massilia niastensis]|uniref:alpha/beta fold hydrolase n=1 Tax=Massilia niastensis TaxID=544911 RepID=UPI0003708DF7|nr:alpha/beta hydrolase [Massilia niastensis]
MNMIKTAALAVAFTLPAIASALPLTVTSGAKNVVLVHGSYVDGSSWRAIHDQLWIKGYKVTVVQQPHNSFDDNVAATRAAIEAQDGPVILVGHDTGGAVISAAGGSGKVKGLVYVAALQPAAGESAAQLIASRPALNQEIQVRDGRQFITPGKFQAVYGADLPPNRTNFMSVAQPGIPQKVLGASAKAAAWRDKPSYAIVATEDLVLNPELQRWMYKRAGSKVTEIKASHALQLSKPEEVAQVIVQAALDAK